ncbi:DUF1027 domain-containing protein [Lentilactobacillus senioris]|uniref:YutD-like domain-containing protein n=1 Tax=Lentilactobacillus senioris TaxID=931534 RepID=UPI00227DEFB6|nr:YutD-like domain-containing protein [Lentilactobacillus senioris]MCY9806734.1 DUF1027 domain-containing protein [Lentilactobacillus senioris]
MDKNELKNLIEERNEKRKPLVKITFEDLTSFSINDHQYKMISDHNNSFDVHQFEMTFNSSFSKFDYIVGQLFDDQLRLRGFYDAGRENADGPFIDQLNDILVEQLIFSDDLYIIQNLEPRPIPVPRSNSRRRRSRRGRQRNRRSNADNKNGGFKTTTTKVQNNEGKRKMVVKEKRKTGNHDFVIKENKKGK